MPYYFESVRFRLHARLHRVFAKAIREEAARRSGGGVPPQGWMEVANWLHSQADQLENKADERKEPRF